MSYKSPKVLILALLAGFALGGVAVAATGSAPFSSGDDQVAEAADASSDDQGEDVQSVEEDDQGEDEQAEEDAAKNASPSVLTTTPAAASIAPRSRSS